MINACGGFVVGTTSFTRDPGSVRQVSGVAVGVAGIGVGGWVAVAVGVSTTGVGDAWTDGVQAERPAKIKKYMVMCIT